MTTCCVEETTRGDRTDFNVVEAVEADSSELSDAITAAGYSPVPLELREALASVSRSRGCCCGALNGA